MAGDPGIKRPQKQEEQERETMRIYDLIAKKRDGGTHTREELEAMKNK